MTRVPSRVSALAMLVLASSMIVARGSDVEELQCEALQQMIEAGWRVGQPRIVIPAGTYRLAGATGRACLSFRGVEGNRIEVVPGEPPR